MNDMPTIVMTSVPVDVAIEQDVLQVRIRCGWLRSWPRAELEDTAKKAP